MKPALFLYPHISSYPVLLLLGFCFGWLLARSRAGLFGIEKRHLDNIALVVPIAGLFGARFFARLFYAKLSFWEALQVWKGDGLVFYGGFLFCASSILVYGVARRVRLVPLMDCLAPAVALGLAFGRLGCFLAGCCWGDVCLPTTQTSNITSVAVREQIHTWPALSTASWPLAMAFPKKSMVYQQHLKQGLIDDAAPASAPVHPVQLYEAALAFVLCGLLHFGSRGRRPGNITLALLFGYAGIRFLTEFLRADNTIGSWGLTFSQAVSLWIIAFALLCVPARAFTSRFSARAIAAPGKPHPAIG